MTGDRVRKTKLKVLMEEFLSERIQEGTGGHCSTEDSLACLKLTQLKLTKSLYFGDAVMGNVANDVKAYPELGTYNYCTSILRQTTRIDKTALVVGQNDITSRYKFFVDKGLCSEEESEKIKFHSEKTCKDVVKKLCGSLNTSSLNIAHLKVENQLEGTKIFKTVDKWTKDIFDNMPTPGLLIVLFTGSEGSNGCCFIQLKRDVC